MSEYNFKTMSFNVRGIQCNNKRKSIFRFIKRKNVDICMLQEAHCILRDELLWRNEWGGDIYYSHGANNARGVMILVKAGFDFKLDDITTDQQGRLIIIKCKIQGLPFQLINVYAPNTTLARLNYFKNLRNMINRSKISNETSKCKTILGGDFNTIIDSKLDRKGGTGSFTADYMKTIKLLNLMQEEFDLCDEWRLRNPDTKRYTWRQKNPPISSRLDMFLISKSLCDFITISFHLSKAITHQ
jgi:exonuclease III